MIVFIVLVLIALGLTLIALKASLILFRLGAALGWLACGIYLLTGGNTSLSISDTWAQVLGFIFIVMTIATLTLQMVTEVRTEKGGKVYKDWVRRKKEKGPTRAQSVQDDHRLRVRAAIERGHAKAAVSRRK